ncbi:MAG TPA: cupin domain-containing protein [Thermomicrobiales bacterium]|nr:cupin domain-containing protein [Thermomicrobiales bacterium]
MFIRHQDKSQGTVDASAMFTGVVSRQELVREGDAPDLRVTGVSFEDGARNKWHSHTTEQVLVVTDGEGIIATDTEERPIVPGDVVLIQAGERHWHGAAPGKNMTHLAILLPGEMHVYDE